MSVVSIQTGSYFPYYHIFADQIANNKYFPGNIKITSIFVFQSLESDQFAVNQVIGIYTEIPAPAHKLVSSDIEFCNVLVNRISEKVNCVL